MKKPSSISKNSELILQDGETVLITGKPVRALLPMLQTRATFVALITIVLIPVLPLLLWLSIQQVEWHRWWVTDRRVVIRTGLVGWEERSIPLNRISDVSLTASWLDRLFGLQHLVVRDMTGEVTQNGQSLGARMLGVADASEVQQILLSEVARSGSEGDEDHLARIVDLLEGMAS